MLPQKPRKGKQIGWEHCLSKCMKKCLGNLASHTLKTAKLSLRQALRQLLLSSILRTLGGGPKEKKLTEKQQRLPVLGL